MGTIIAPNRATLQLKEPHRLGPYIEKYKETHSLHPKTLSENFIGKVLKRIRDDSSLILRGQEQFDRLVSVVNGRMRESGTGCKGYLELIDSDRSEVKLLVRNFLVPFTYFFREGDVLREFERKLKERGNARAGGPIRIWNPGCSFGAETYSIAMILGEIKNAPKSTRGSMRGEILATDINDKALNIARAGRYSPEFIDEGGDLLGYLKRFRCKGMLQKDRREGIFSVDRSLKPNVRFERHDLLADEYPKGIDFVFCRHVIMHIRKESVRSIISRIHKILKKGGALFVGKQESLAYVDMIEDAGFVPEHHSNMNIPIDFYTFTKH